MKRLSSTLGIAAIAAVSLLMPAAAGAKITPITGASWAGVSDSTVTPPDTNGAIGPTRYVEIINLKLGIYSRTGGTVSTARSPRRRSAR